MTLPAFDFYTRLEYFDELVRQLDRAQAGDVVTLMTMQFDPRIPEIASISRATRNAVRRGANVSLIVDALCFTLAKHSMPGPYFYGKQPSASSAGVYGLIYRELAALRKAGGSYTIVNQPKHAFANPYAGRSHIKLALVNERIFIPTCNLDNNRNFDVVVAWSDVQTADWLHELVGDIRQVGNVRQALNSHDRTQALNDRVTLLVDSGIPGSSTIYNKALELVDSHPKRLFMTCQYLPGDITGEHLAAAVKAGSKLELYFGHPSSHGKQAAMQTIYNTLQRKRFPAAMFRNMLPAGAPKLHAKILSGDSTTMVGSHNFVSAGVRFGTAELALRVEDSAFAKTLRQKIVAQLPTVVTNG